MHSVIISISYRIDKDSIFEVLKRSKIPNQYLDNGYMCIKTS